MSKNLINLSRTVAHALRHEPYSYNLQLDTKGWVCLNDLIHSLNDKRIVTSKEEIIKMVTAFDKSRFQISENRIRAYYGHSTEEKIKKTVEMPPAILYHGTKIINLNDILQNGLLPMSRQYVHLASDIEKANLVAKRKGGEVMIFKICADYAFRDGIKFYKEENGVWLSETVPSKYIYL